MKLKQILIRLAFVAVLLAIAGVMLVIGRGHTVYFDNKTLTVGEETYSAPYKVEVYVKGERAAKLNARDRGMATWIGQNFRMTLRITQEKGGEESSREIALTLPYSMDGIVLNLPGLLAGLPEEEYLTEFIAVPTAEEMEEEPSEGGDDFGLDLEGMDTEF